MMESFKTQLDFPSPVIQAQAVRNLVAAVLKEKEQNGKITQSSTQGPALKALWEQCNSDCALVRSVCCDAVVLLVVQGHADLNYIINSVLNSLPTARNVQGLIKVIGRMLQMQADQRERGTHFTCPYSIRSNPHPYITALENRVDCWSALLLEIDDFIQLATERNEPAYIIMVAPFLQYVFCEPQRQPQYALLRHSLLRVLLPVHPQNESVHQPEDIEKTSRLSESLLQFLCQLVPHMQVENVEAVLELCGFVTALYQGFLKVSEERWRSRRAMLVLQLLCASQHCLKLNGDCRPLLNLIQHLIPAFQQGLPVDELILGIALLLLEAPAAQQTCLLNLALSLIPEQGELSPWSSQVLVLPVLQLLSCSNLTEALTERRTHSLNQDLAHSLLGRISKKTEKPQQPGPVLAMPLSSWYSELSVALSILRKVADDPVAASDWLLSVHSALSSSQILPCSLTLIVTHLIITGQDDICQLALNTSQAIAAADSCQVPALLPVLLFKLGKKNNPGLSHAVLCCLPNLGTHKLCVPMVLQTLHMLAKAPKLRAVAMRLMTALWKKQDRVYPELLRLLAQQDNRVVVGRDTQWEQTLARAACIRDICKERPHQHGGDMLAAITLTLSQCSRPDMATPAALALQGLQELCRAEVVDIISTWKSVGRELSCDSRQLMVKAIAELLALVPQLTVKSEEYEKLKEVVVSLLWNYSASKDPEVASCGYRALAEFPETVHTINFLPEAVRPATKPPEGGEKNEKKEEEEEKDLSVAGSSYIKLMTLTSISVLPAFNLFLTSLVKQEMTQMPRRVYFSALRGGNMESDKGKTVSGIPSFLLKTYEKNKQPGLKPGLAAGLLLCYELRVQRDRDGKPIDRFLVSRSHSYQQMVTALIHEVNIQPSEWHRALLLPCAWRSFMSRAFHAVLQGRHADLELQQKQGKENPEELHYKQRCAWLWARDLLTDVIKAASKDSPVVQGNSILALSGLAAVVAKYESNLPADGDGNLGAGPEFVPTTSWLAMVLDTLLSIISSIYKATGQVFPWFLHRSYSGENTASAIARSCASLALSVLVPVLVVWQRDGLIRVLSALQAGLPDSPTADDSQTVQFHSGLALGMVLSSLHQERLSDLSVQKHSDLLLQPLRALESCSFNPDLEYNTGCTLGLGLVLAALCNCGQMEQHNYVTQTLDKLLLNLQDSGGQGRMQQEVLAYTVACVGVSAFSAGIIDSAKAELVMNSLRTMTEESQQTPGLSLALGLVVHGLSTSGHGKAEDLHPRLLAAWIKILLAETCPTMQQLAAVNGLVALVGSESYLIQLKLDLSSQQQSRLNEVIRAIIQIITFSGAIGLQSNSACLVGHLHLAHMSTSHSHTAVPQDFSYLSEKSVVRAIIDFIIETGKKGPEFYHPNIVNTALTSLASVGADFQYPPMNWNVVLSPLMRLSFGSNVQHQCLMLAECQAQSSKSASLFLGSWLTPPLVHSLSCHTRSHLYETVGLWMKHVAEDKLQFYVETLGLQHFQEDVRPQRQNMCRSMLQGLAQAMALPNPPNNCWAILCSSTEKIFNVLPNLIQDGEVDLYVGIAKCLTEMSDEEIARITQVTEAQIEKSCFVLAYLTSHGRVPLLGLNDVIAGVLCGWPRRRVGWLLLQTFYQCRWAPSNITGVSKRMEWLLELMGYIRNVTYGAKSVMCGDTKMATDFLFQVFAAAVVSWGDQSMPVLLGIRAQWFPWQHGNKGQSLTHSLYGADVLADHALAQCLLGMPHSLALLLGKEPWKSQTHKFIDWLFSIIEGPGHNLSTITVSTAKVALLALKSSTEFKKKAIWTRAYGW